MSVILTFHRKMAPYESSWLIFIKSLRINDISLKDFVSMLVNKQKPQITVANFRWLESYDFDVVALSSTLRLPLQIVDNAFLDRLVNSPFLRSPSAVRHCSECIKKFYHCSLFQLLWLTECPVHHVELKDCRECAATFKDHKIKTLRGESNYSICGHLHPFIEEQFPVHTLTEDECARFSAWGESLATWFRRAEEIGAEDDLLKLISSPLSYHDANNRFSYWRYLEGKIGLAPLAIPAPGYSVDKLSLDCLNSDNVWTQETSLGHLVACFKSLRRHLYKKFVRPHRRCINQFNRLNLRGYYALNGHARCSCSLAYYSWLITTTNLYTMEDLKGSEFGGISPYARDGRFDRYTDNASVGMVLLEAWVIFHDYWAFYELHGWNDPEPTDMLVQLRSARGFEHKFHNFSLHTRTPGTGAPKNCYFPSGSYLLSRSLARCRTRQGKSLVLTNRKVEVYCDFINMTRETIFEVRYENTSSRKARLLRI